MHARACVCVRAYVCGCVRVCMPVCVRALMCVRACAHVRVCVLEGSSSSQLQRGGSRAKPVVLGGDCSVALRSSEAGAGGLGEGL